MKRPDGVTIISIYHYFTAGLLLLGACCLAVIPFIVAAAASAEPDAEVAVPIVAIVMGVGLLVVLVLAAAYGAIGWGLWRLKPWGRWGAIVVAVLGLLAIPLGTIIGVAVLWYMFQPEALTVLAKRTGSPPGRARLRRPVVRAVLAAGRPLPAAPGLDRPVREHLPAFPAGGTCCFSRPAGL
jgi:O-antigen ligase